MNKKDNIMSRNLMAILRGVKPHEVVALGEQLLQVGIHQIEVPLNSPNALESIAKLHTSLGDRAFIGAGTVLNVAEAKSVYAHGGQFIVSPNCNSDVIKATKDMGMMSYPGVFTPTECFSALESGADLLKLFPAFLLGLNGFKALQAVLPDKVECYAVGGIGSVDFSDWRKAGIAGFGLASNLYKPGDSPEQLASKAALLVKAWDDTL
jgi:2-dehydro-3-deoxyphosphogalactonate aldolase